MSPLLPSLFAPGSGLNCFKNSAWQLCLALWSIQERPEQWLQKWSQPSHRLHRQTKSSTINFGFWIIANDLNLYAWALMSGHGAQCTQRTSTFVIPYFRPWWRCTQGDLICRVWRWPPLALKAFVFGTNFPSISNDCLLSKLICWGADFNNLYFRANVASLFMGDRNVAERVNVVQWEGHRLWDPSGHQDHQRTTCATWLWTWPAAYDLSSLRLSKMMRLAAITPTSQR